MIILPKLLYSEIGINKSTSGNNVLMFSLEMNKEQLLNRIVSAEKGIFANKYRNNSFTEKEAEKYFSYMYSDELNNLNIQTCTEYKITVDRIRNIALASKSDIIFIDYIGLISSSNKQSSYERVSEISRELKEGSRGVSGIGARGKSRIIG